MNYTLTTKTTPKQEVSVDRPLTTLAVEVPPPSVQEITKVQTTVVIAAMLNTNQFSRVNQVKATLKTAKTVDNYSYLEL
jgi:hypothetical protein